MDTEISFSKKIKQKALELGFTDIGISEAAFLDKESQQLKKWLKNGFHGEMKYMENYFEKRVDPGKLVENAKSVISVLYNYFPSVVQPTNTFKIAKYAYGRDYHFVVKEKLNVLFNYIKTLDSDISGRIFVDSAPVMEKSWAAKAGLGWIGKNTNLISKKHGSFLFIGEIIINLKLEKNKPIKDYCGTCTKCVDACPTKALKPYQLDARKCISYLTIEKRGEIPVEFKNQWSDWIFGCDICQDVCPWNLKTKAHSEKDFYPKPEILTYTKQDWEKINPEEFKSFFNETPLERTKFEGTKRNIDFLRKEDHSIADFDI